MQDISEEDSQLNFSLFIHIKSQILPTISHISPIYLLLNYPLPNLNLLIESNYRILKSNYGILKHSETVSALFQIINFQPLWSHLYNCFNKNWKEIKMLHLMKYYSSYHLYLRERNLKSTTYKLLFHYHYRSRTVYFGNWGTGNPSLTSIF